MNTRNAYALRSRQAGKVAPFGLGTAPRPLALADADMPPHPACATLPNRVCRHVLADRNENARLNAREQAVKGRFDAIVPALKAISALQHGADFVERAQALARQQLGYALPEEILENAWSNGLDVKALYARCVFAALLASAEEFSAEYGRRNGSWQDLHSFFLDCGFHAIDISPCADGRLKGLLPYILRLPATPFIRRKAYAGAMFDVETDVRQWMAVELGRFREGVPNLAEAETRYLKIAVYHLSSSSPDHEGCAAHGSDDSRAIEAALQRLLEFRQAIENSFCCGAGTDILLIGVDTDTDAIRVHVPDENGNLSASRYVDNAALYAASLGFGENEAMLAVHQAILDAGASKPHEGMRRLIANLLINNLSQIEYVAEYYGGRYQDIGHAERYISVGDGFEEVQMRNVAYYAHLHTLEEGMADMDIGIKIFRQLMVRRGLPVPIAIHFRYDARVPGSRTRAVSRTKRVEEAIRSRYLDLDAAGLLACHLTVQDLPAGSLIEEIIDENHAS
ncbi:MAG: carboxysome shell carbonic anhydrase [Burkholderiales bacterium]